ncbi:MAG: Gfo/Idh/MocA family oxidoreductase, partial [Candidatus Marinimicrobia bacterium]|nr:Gfo/Idh/MocA family oxidoreductase [Candidatus Neomarinimicrobiota bacterium]
MSQPIKVIQLGLGFIGQGIFDILAERDGFQVVAAVDPDPAKADVLPGIKAVLSLAEALAKGTADVAVLTTTSRMDTITPQILELLENGLHVVSTCEELVYPWDTAPKLAASIDQAARDSGLAVLST